MREWYFFYQSPTLKYQSFLYFSLSFLSGSQVKSHWSTVSKTWVWRETSRLLTNDQNHLFSSSPWPSDLNPGRIYSAKAPHRPRTCAFIQHNRKLTMLTIKSFTCDSFSSTHSHTTDALILPLRRHLSWITILRYTQTWNVVQLSKPHEWNLLGIESGGWVSDMVRPGKLTTPNHCHKHSKARATYSPWQRQQLAGWKHSANHCHCLEHQLRPWETHFVATWYPRGNQITHEPLWRFRGIMDCWRLCWEH